MNPVDPLPSWNDSNSKNAIVQFVESVTDPDNDQFVEPADRIAAFDNDGTLWSEQPMYTEMAFLIDQVRRLAPQHPEWKERGLFRSILHEEIPSVVAGGGPVLFEMAVEVMNGVGAEAYQDRAGEWLSQTRHPDTGRIYLEMTFQPQRELIAWLHERHFRVFIVSGGTIDFVRPISEQVYGIPKECVVGSSVLTQFAQAGEHPELLHRPHMHFVDDGVGKPVGIYQSIGRRPVLACGNSDGDLAMFEWTAASPRPHHCVLIHHTDDKREFKYDADSPCGRLHDSLIAAKDRGWTIVDMKDDWNQVFPPQTRIRTGAGSTKTASKRGSARSSGAK